jgi:hypothetical protein
VENGPWGVTKKDELLLDTDNGFDGAHLKDNVIITTIFF